MRVKYTLYWIAMIRYEYVEWMKNYEDDLYKYWLYSALQKEEMVENTNDL